MASNARDLIESRRRPPLASGARISAKVTNSPLDHTTTILENGTQDAYGATNEQGIPFSALSAGLKRGGF